MTALTTGAFIGLAALVGFSDIRSRKIPNWLTVSTALTGLGLSAILGGMEGLRLSAGGLAVGLGIGFVLALTPIMGAGDAKYLAAVGAWAGWERFPSAALAMLGGGALFALAWAARQRLLRATLASTAAMIGVAVATGDRLSPAVGSTTAGRFPYGVGLGLGAIGWWLWAGRTMP